MEVWRDGLQAWDARDNEKDQCLLYEWVPFNAAMQRDARRKMVIFAFVLSACSRRTKRLESARMRPPHKLSMERFSSDYQSRTLARPNIAAFRRWGRTICLDACRDACHEKGARGAGGWPDRSDDDDYRAADSTEESNRDERREWGEEQGRSKEQKGCG